MQTDKKKYIHLIRAGFLTLVLLLGFSQSFKQSSRSEYRNNTLQRYENLFTYLEEKNLPLTDFRRLFLDPRVEYYDNIAVNYYKPPTMDSYSSIFFHIENKGYEIEEFINTFEDQLNVAEQSYGVNKEAIVAVLYVETKLGKVIGRYSVFNILSSLALADSPESLAKIENHVYEKYHYLDYDQRRDLIAFYKERANRKAEWAKAECASLIKLHLESHIDILELPGSYAGAFGYSQFIPSSVLRYGVDGDNDGKVDLYNYTDAIMSVANFLSHKGWDEEKSNQQKALLRYNNSRSYVANVLKTASTIKNDIVF
ncbi:MAG TPA: hypothetical protein DHW42_09875 [Candidatus Marinimicrobia bacterium]|nr:hypothetical protein [Candidatus Neomarinimicrobiota bacterium]